MWLWKYLQHVALPWCSMGTRPVQSQVQRKHRLVNMLRSVPPRMSNMALANNPQVIHVLEYEDVGQIWRFRPVSSYSKTWMTRRLLLRAGTISARCRQFGQSSSEAKLQIWPLAYYRIIQQATILRVISKEIERCACRWRIAQWIRNNFTSTYVIDGTK